MSQYYKVILPFSVFLVSVLGDDRCIWYRGSYDAPPEYRNCEYGCCYEYIYPCCSRPVGEVVAEVLGIMAGVVVGVIVLSVIAVMVYRKYCRPPTTPVTITTTAAYPPPQGQYLGPSFGAPPSYSQAMAAPAYQQTTPGSSNPQVVTDTATHQLAHSKENNLQGY